MMQNLIDFAVALGIFLAFMGVMLSYVISHYSQYSGMLKTSELRGMSLVAFNTFFKGKGVPENWEESGLVPVKIGLLNDLYKVVINLTETNGTNRGEIILNFTYQFDLPCTLKAWNTSVIIYNATNQKVEFKLYNQTFCSENFLKTAEIVLKTSLNAYESKIFYMYFSPEKQIVSSQSDLPYSFSTNYTVEFYPQQQLEMVSVGKLKGLRGLDYNQVLQTFSQKYKFRIEVDE